MNPILEKAIDHQKSKETQSIFIEEWDCEICFTELSLAERKKLEKLSNGNTFEMAAYTLILKSLDKNGNKIFDLSDKPHLMASVDSKVIERIFVAMVGGVDTVEQAEKN